MNTEAIITLRNPRNGYTEMLTTKADHAHIVALVLSFSVRECLPPLDIEYSVLWPAA